MLRNTKNISLFLIVLAGVFWGAMGIFVRSLGGKGFSSLEITALRLGAAAVVFAVILALRGKKSKVALRNLPILAANGVFSVFAMSVCYFSAIGLTSLSTAAILLYTAPIFVMIMSFIFFREKLTPKKACAILFAFAGCVLVAGIGGSVTPVGVLLGLGSGLAYALYSIFGTAALRQNSPFNVTAYSFIVAAVCAVAAANPRSLISKLAEADASTWLTIVLMALCSVIIPYTAYTAGLKYTEPGAAAVSATVEPLAATLIGIFIYNERLTPLTACGICLILAAIILLNLHRRTRTQA